MAGQTYTVVLRYADHDSNMWCGVVEAADAIEAVKIAEDECADDNGWDPRHEDDCFTDHWNDSLVFSGKCEVVG